MLRVIDKNGNVVKKGDIIFLADRNVGYTPDIGQDIAESVILKNQVNRIVDGDMLIALGFEQGRKLGMMLQIFESMQDRDEISSENWGEMVPTVELVADIFLED